MTRAAIQRLVLVLLPALSIVEKTQAQEVKPEFVAVRAGFANRYKVGLWTPLEVTLRGGSKRIERCYVRATLEDSDGLNCSYEPAEACTLFRGADTKVLLYVRFGRQEDTLSLELLDEDRKTLAAKTIDSTQSATSDHFADALQPGQRLIVSIEQSGSGLEKAKLGNQNVVAVLDSMARLPTLWQGYEGVDIVVISTSRPGVFNTLLRNNARIAALEQWIRMGGTLVLCAGSHADEALHNGSPLAGFAPGHFQKTVSLRQTSGWETYAKSVNPIPPPKPGESADLPTPRLIDPQGKIEAHEADLPLVIRRPLGLGQVVFVATDLDRGPISAWSDRKLLMDAILNLPPTIEQADVPAVVGPSYGYNDLAGQLRSALDVPRDVHLVPFFAVALLVIVYILLIGPGDYFLLRRLGRGMQWTWLTFPAIVLLFSAGAYVAAYWLKGDQLRVSQLDLVDVDAEGTARGASWFSVFSPRGESFDLSMRPRLLGGQSFTLTSASLAWLGKAGNEFNGMYGRSAKNSSPLWGQGYSIASSLDAIHRVPIQVWASKSFVFRWLGGSANLGLDSALTDNGRQLVGTLINRLANSDPQAGKGVVLSHCFLVYENWAYEIGTLRADQPFEIGPTTRRLSLATYINDSSISDSEGDFGKSEKTAYDRGNRDMDYVLQTMLFYDAASGRKRTGMANDYQGFTDLSGLLKAGRAVLVAMPPQDGSCRGGELLRGSVPKSGGPDDRQPLGNALDRHTTVYRFVLPVTQTGPTN